MSDKAKNLFVGGFGLVLLAIGGLVIVALARQGYCWRTKSCTLLEPQPDSVYGAVPADYFNDSAPDVTDEVGETGTWETHPIIVDMVPRMAAIFETQPVAMSFMQYRGYFFFEWRDSASGEFWVFVYRWNGSDWVYVADYCETCQATSP